MSIIAIVLLVALLIPIMASLFDSPIGRALARRLEGPERLPAGLDELSRKVDLPPGDAFRVFLVDTLAAQVRTLAEQQDESGLWHTLILDPSSYLEASATAGFA